MFAQGDAVLLWALYEYMYLQTGMLVKKTGRHRGSILRRLRWLCNNGFVISLSRPMMENVFVLGNQGWDFIAKELQTTPAKLPYSRKASRLEGLFLRHTLQTVRFWIDLEMSTSTHEHVALHKSIPEWEMADPRAKDTTKKFVLWERLKDSDDKKKLYSFRPDAAFLAYNRHVGPHKLAVLFLEADRGSQAIASRIRDKMIGFRIFFQKGLFKKLYGAQLMRVLFLLEGGERRIRNMQHQLTLLAENMKDPNPADPLKEPPTPASFVHVFRFAMMKDISAETVLEKPIWRDWQNKEISLFSPQKRSTGGFNG